MARSDITGIVRLVFTGHDRGGQQDRRDGVLVPRPLAGRDGPQPWQRAKLAE